MKDKSQHVDTTSTFVIENMFFQAFCAEAISDQLRNINHSYCAFAVHFDKVML
jgi:hypothetical protein